MYLKKEVFLLVILLVLPIVNSGVDDFSCGSILFGSCDGSLMCGSNNLILNGGFEILENGKPKNFVKNNNPVAILNDGYRSERSVKLTNAWDSFDYEVNMNTNEEYIFFSYVKGNCNGLRVYYGEGSNSQEICDKRCGSVVEEEGWKRISVQFTPQFNSGKLRVECNVNSDFLVDAMHLQKVSLDNSLTNNCQVCGCNGDYVCSLNGNCIEKKECNINELIGEHIQAIGRQEWDEMTRIVEEISQCCENNPNDPVCVESAAVKDSNQEAVNAVLAKDLNRIRALAKPVSFAAIDQYLLEVPIEEKDLSLCEEGTPECVDKVLTVACSDDRECKKDLALKSWNHHPDFVNGENIEIVTDSEHKQVIDFKFGGDGSNNGCRLNYESGYGKTTNVDTETIYESGKIFKYDAENNILNEHVPSNYDRYVYCNFKEKCELLDFPDVKPRADLLCGHDNKWYLCNRGYSEEFGYSDDTYASGEIGTDYSAGIKEFDTGEKYLCVNKRWTSLN